MSSGGDATDALPDSGPRPTPTWLLGFELNVLVPGCYAWATTLALPAAGTGAPLLARGAAGVALVALLLGPLLVMKRPLLGRLVGIEGFVLASVAGWVALDRAGLSFASRPLEATVGAIGWMLFAFGWGDLRARRGVPESDPRVLPGAALFPRTVLPRSVELIAFIGVSGAVLLSVLAWSTARPAHALFAHAAALVLGLLLISAALRVALERGQRRPAAPSARLNAASTSLAALLIALGLGALYWMLER